MIDVERPPRRAEAIFSNFCLQLADQALTGSLVVRDGKIADIATGSASSGASGAHEFLLPGLIELHTDHLESCIAPRPGITWPLASALAYHDRAMLAAGITTVCDAVAIGDLSGSPTTRSAHVGAVIEALAQAREAGRFTADHRLHLRCELTYDELLPVYERYVDEPHVVLISLMDHTPGQRQFTDLDKFKQYYIHKHGVPPSEIDAFIEARIDHQRAFAAANRRCVVRSALERGIALATHDDTTLAHVREACEDGAAIAEFPTTREAAAAARKAGMDVLMGAPNLVLGGSHSGNVPAAELIAAGLVDIISSDYVPQSLLEAVFTSARLTGAPVYEAMRPVTEAPARAIGLGDRGRLEVGMRADFITVDARAAVPRITGVYVAGTRVA